MGDTTVRDLRLAPPPPVVAAPFRALRDIPPALIQQCNEDKQGLNHLKRAMVAVSVVSVAAAGASRFTYHEATGNWGEGLASATPKFPGKVLDLISGRTIPTPDDHLTDTFWGKMTIGLTGVAGAGLGASLVIGAGYDFLESAYQTKCIEVEMARAAETLYRGSVVNLLDNLPSSDEARMFVPPGDLGVPANVIPQVSPLAPITSTHWYDGAERFARDHTAIAASVAVVGIVAYGAAIYFTGGAAAVALAF